jgi:hypothetical protein
VASIGHQEVIHGTGITEVIADSYSKINIDDSSGSDSDNILYADNEIFVLEVLPYYGLKSRKMPLPLEFISVSTDNEL